MKRICKNVLLMLLVIAMMLSMVACGGTGTAIPTGGNEQGGEQTGGNEPGGEVELGTVSYPLDTDHVLSIWCPDSVVPVYKTYDSYKQSPWHSGLVKQTGVEVEWRFPVAGAVSQQAYNLMMLDEVLPDIICWGMDPGEAQMLYNEGAIIDLREYLPKYAPDYWEFINAPGNEEYLRSVTTEEGQIYMVRHFLEEDSVAYGPVVRKDWLDECNLDIPVTIEDWEEMLIAFRDRYGAKFTFPISRFTRAGLASGFGAFSGLNCQYYLDDGEIKLAQTQPEYVEYLGTLARWVDEGLLDVDSLTMTDEGFRTKALNGSCGAAFVVMSLFTQIINDAQAEYTTAEWIAVPYPVVEEGQSTNWVHYTSRIYESGCVISTSCPEEEIATALQWLNYGYTEEGLLYFNYGVEGDTYTIDDNGIVKFTDKVLKDRDGPAAATRKYTGMGNVAFASIQLKNFSQGRNHPSVAQGAELWASNTEAGEHAMPVLVLTADESVRHADLFMAIGTYCNEVSMKIIAGEIDISEYDTIIQNIYNLGLQEALDIQNAAYQRYLNQK